MFSRFFLLEPRKRFFQEGMGAKFEPALDFDFNSTEFEGAGNKTLKI